MLCCAVLKQLLKVKVKPLKQLLKVKVKLLNAKAPVEAAPVAPVGISYTIGVYTDQVQYVQLEA